MERRQTKPKTQEAWKRSGSCLFAVNSSIQRMVTLLIILRLGLFRCANTDEIAFVIDENSTNVSNYMRKFEFFGKTIAKAIIDEIPLTL
jgi:hypothetical protein